MREDQIIALSDVQAEVCDVFLAEARVGEWPTMDTREGRGDRKWYKDNASASLRIVAQIEQVLAARAARLANNQGSLYDEDQTDQLLSRIRRKADTLLDRAGVDARKK